MKAIVRTEPSGRDADCWPCEAGDDCPLGYVATLATLSGDTVGALAAVERPLRTMTTEYGVSAARASSWRPPQLLGTALSPLSRKTSVSLARRGLRRLLRAPET